MIQRGESPGHSKLAAFGKKHVERGESPDHAKLAGNGHRHDDPAMVRKEQRTFRNPRLTKPMRFVSLHHHSTYSFLDGYALPEAHARRIAELNGTALAMTEHGNIMSHVKFEKACNDPKSDAYGIKPIFGIELYCGEIDPERRTQLKNHLTVLAKNQEGYKNVLQLVSRSHSEGFYYAPTVSGQMLREHGNGLVVLSGCQGSLLFTSLVGGKHIPASEAGYRRGRDVAARFKRAMGDAYVLEVQAFPGLSLTNKANPMIARISRELEIPMVVTLDCHYTMPTEQEMQQILHSIRGGGKQTPEEQAQSWGYAAELCPPMNDRHLLKLLMETGVSREQAIRAINLTAELAEDMTVEIPHLPMVRYPLPPGFTDGWQVFESWIKEGWKYRGFDQKLSPRELREYKKRIRYEMSIIKEKDFADYFLVVSDLVRFAKDADIGVGPARGSAAASLVCYLLRITEVNPMQFPHLVFERFIDITREDLPDIDLDFESTRRGEIVDYLVAKYGREYVSQIGTFSTYKSKIALDDVARVYRIPKFEVDQIKDVLLERSSGDLRASATIEDTIEQFDQAKGVVERHPNIMKATRLEGNVRGFGIHAAGVAVSNQPITDVTSILEREVNKRMVQVIAIDKYDAEQLGILKIDLLGLSAVDALVDMCRGLGEKPSFLYDIPIEDPEVVKGFEENDVVGIFQYEGRAVRMVNGSVKAGDFAEVCHVIALGRPGPLHNGAVADYVDIKRGVKEPTIKHPALAHITEFTQFQIVYQEQILRIVREIGNFDWTHAAYIRKIISRKLGDQEFNRQWERFRDGALTVHERMDVEPIDEEMARSIWGDLITSGSYAFNFAHSVSYGYISWWMMWFKRHHPELFYAAMLDRADKKGSGGGGSNAKASGTSKAKLDPQVIMLRDSIAHGFKILPYDLFKSDATWKNEGDRALRPGFDQIDGVGPAMAAKIIDWRDAQSKTRLGRRGLGWSSLIDVKGIGEKTIVNIVEHATAEDPFGVQRLEKMISAVKKDLPKLNLPSPTHTAIEVPYERGEDELVIWVGVAVHKNLRDIFEVNRARTGEELNRDEVKDPELNEWMLLTGYDGTDLLSLRVDRWKYPELKDILWKIDLHEDVLLVQGVKKGWRAAREIKVKKIWVIDAQI
jgi:DNA polymerase III subunit alpha